MNKDPTRQSQTLSTCSQASASSSFISATNRRTFITAVLNSCTPDELHYISETVGSMLKRDFLSILPPELALHILGFVDNPVTLLRTSAVSRTWRALAVSEGLWKQMCIKWGFGAQNPTIVQQGSSLTDEEPLEEMEPFAALPMDPALTWLTERKRRLRRAASDSSSLSDVSLSDPFSYYVRFKEIYNKILRWKRGGCLLRTHRLPMLSASVEQPLPVSLPSTSPKPRVKGASSTKNEQPDSGVVTSIALDNDWVVVGLVSSRIHVFSARTGVLARTLVGHGSGVWGLSLVSASPRNKSKGKARDKERGDNAPSAELPSLNFGGGSWKSTSRRTDANGGTNRGLYHSLPPTLRTAVGLEFSNEFDSPSEISDEESSAVGTGHLNDPDALESSARGHTQTKDGRENVPLYVPDRQSNPSFASDGWGQPNALVVSGGCDKVVRVWDIKSGHCIYALGGHASTIRCVRTLHNRPLAVTGSRDGVIRTWDIQRGIAVHVLSGHSDSIRSLDVNGRRAVSGSYDTTCRIWDLDTGQCLHVLQGHFQRIYAVAFDGVLVVTGSLDTTVRVWNAETGHCIALLQQHIALVCHIQLSRKQQLLITGDSDGRVIAFPLSSSDSVTPAPVPFFSREETKGKQEPLTTKTRMKRVRSITSPNSDSESERSRLRSTRAAYEPLYRLSAHAASLTSLQFNGRFLLTSGNDGCVHLWETQTGRYVRRMTKDGEVVWKAGFTTTCEGTAEECEEAVGDVSIIAGRRDGKTMLEIWGYGEPSKS